MIDAMGAVLLGLEFLGCLHMQAKNPGASVAENDNNYRRTIMTGSSLHKFMMTDT